jgi:putative inorganic carbon (hco3(-)) transporter
MLPAIFYVLAFATPLFWLPYNYELFEFNKMLLVYFLTIVSGTAVAWQYIRSSQILIPRTPLDIPIILFLGSQVAATIISIDPYMSIWGYYGRFNGGLVSTICYILLYYFLIICAHYYENTKADFEVKIKRYNLIVHMLSPRSFSQWLACAATASAVAVSLYAVLQKWGIDAHLWVQDVQNRVFSTLGQPNWLAAYITTMFLIVVGIFIGSSRRSGKASFILFTFTASLFYLVLLFTRSRSGLLACMGAALLFIVLLIFKIIRPINVKVPFIRLVHDADMYRLSMLTKLFVLGIFCVAVTLILSDAITLPSIKQLPATTIETETSPVTFDTNITDSGDIRKIVWKGAFNAVREKPWFGWGVETFAWVYYRFKPIEHNLTSEWDFLYNKAHNEYLNYAATSGLIGLGTYILIIIVFSITTLGYIIKNTTRQSIIIAGLFSGWISLLISHFFGFSVVVTSLLFWLIPAVVYAKYHMYTVQTINFSLSPLIRNSVRTVVFLVACILIRGVFQYWLGDFYFAKSMAAAQSNHYEAAAKYGETAVSLRPAEPVYQNDLSETLSVLAFAEYESGEATASARLARQAMDYSAQALSISPFNVSFWKTRTRLFYNLSPLDPSFLQEALTSIQTARRLAPTDPKVIYNEAILLGELNRDDEAIATLGEAIKLKSNYRDAAYALAVFYEGKKDNEQRDEWLRYILEKINPEDSEVKEKLGL